MHLINARTPECATPDKHDKRH